MVTEAEILNIDRNTNTCQVRIPLFETAGSNGPIILTAAFSIVPGIYNSYIVGDKVFIAFENNSIDRPLVIGKIYLGQSDEQLRNAGAINCTNIKIEREIALPINGTNFVFTNVDNNSLTQTMTTAANYPNLLTLINTVNLLADRLKTAEEAIEALTKKINQ